MLKMFERSNAKKLSSPSTDILGVLMSLLVFLCISILYPHLANFIIIVIALYMASKWYKFNLAGLHPIYSITKFNFDKNNVPKI